MDDAYRVSGGVGRVPGVVGPAALDGRAGWVPVRPGADLLSRLEARLGSEVDAWKLVLDVLAPLCPDLEGAPLGALLALLPPPLAWELAQPDLALNERVRPVQGAGALVAEVARLTLQPPERALVNVRAVLASAREALAPADAELVAARLPADLAGLWRSA